jgi:hypothetical protein
MRRQGRSTFSAGLLGRKAWLVGALVLGALFTAPGCQSSLPTSLDGKTCDAQGRCAAGYVCDPGTNLCVRAGSPLHCNDGQTVCANGCVEVSSDANNCGGCDTHCTAPANGRAVCADSRC